MFLEVDRDVNFGNASYAGDDRSGDMWAQPPPGRLQLNVQRTRRGGPPSRSFSNVLIIPKSLGK
jgi:hypothetical protein